MSKITIRKMKESDLYDLSLLYKRFWNDDSDVSKMTETYSQLEKNEDYYFLSAFIENRLVGSLLGIICYELYGECKPFLLVEDLIVDKLYERKGIGTLLLNEIERIGREKECSQIQFITERFRNETIEFYKNQGFDAETHIGFKREL